jgi:hypothetical protein
MEIDHLLPKALGGITELINLWLACSGCNDRKSKRIAVPDPETGEIVLLFDPRRQLWSEHFGWSPTGERVVALTPALST